MGFGVLMVVHFMNAEGNKVLTQEQITLDGNSQNQQVLELLSTAHGYVADGSKIRIDIVPINTDIPSEMQVEIMQFLTNSEGFLENFRMKVRNAGFLREATKSHIHHLFNITREQAATMINLWVNNKLSLI